MSEHEVPTGTTGPGVSTVDDPELQSIVGSEEKLLERTKLALATATRRVVMDYDQELLSLRDQIAEARLEDVPPLVQQMERLQSIAARRAEVSIGHVDARCPYFGHLRLEEKGRTRDVLIGNATFIDTERGVRIVDWRDAPISQLYYRYGEGDEYEEEIGGRTLEGKILVRRSVVIRDGVLRRVIAPQGTFVRQGDGPESTWRRMETTVSKLSGGQGTAERPPLPEEYQIRRGRLGVRVAGREDRHLPEIPALIDPRQFELISRPASGLVVIQGGAGSGKTTIGLHRIAYLNYHDPRRFSPERILVVVFNDALVAYISRVLPGLGVEGVQVVTYTEWASNQRRRHLPRLPREYAEDTPPVVTRIKKHPVMLKLIDERVSRETEAIGREIESAVEHTTGAEKVRSAWRATQQWTVAQRVTALGQWLRGEREIDGVRGDELPSDTRYALEAALDRVRSRSRDVVWDWAELITDAKALRDGFARYAPGAVTETEIAQMVQYCSGIVGRVAIHRPEEQNEREEEGKEHRRVSTLDRDDFSLEDIELPRRRGRRSGDDNEEDFYEADDPYRAVDGVNETEQEQPVLDREDDAILLRLYQRKRGPLRRDRKQTLLYEHVFIDEAQDLSPVEMSVLLDCVTPARSVTLAGDTAQRLLLDNGFTDWQTVLSDLGLSGIAVEPLKIGYRSTQEVMEFARAVLGPLADPEPPVATRSGAPVELHCFPDVGAAVAFLGEVLRELAIEEPRANVAIIARDPERADLYFEGLRRAEVPRLSRVRVQDFSFRPGVEVTDVRQVKGLEFDYVVLVDVDTAHYPVNDESRHLLHIGATRAAHQLWLVAIGEPSRLLPVSMRQ